MEIYLILTAQVDLGGSGRVLSAKSISAVGVLTGVLVVGIGGVGSSSTRTVASLLLKCFIVNKPRDTICLLECYTS